MSFNPGNTIADLKTAIGAIATSQITGITRVYANEPDGPPENGSLIVGSPRFEVVDDTNAKLKVRLTFPLRLCFRRDSRGEDIVKCESYTLPMILAYSSWVNQTLDSDSFLTEVKDGGTVQFVYADQTMRALLVNVTVLTEFNIPTS
jgi:hypothetical protein